ncbi:MAG: FtsX-like permease family protein [candidate division Zixibacteria bacterium]|nr:FtsX-like permease family protein [candidate division Zixibacteria bacterium]
MYAIINIIGLAIGLTGSFLIAGFVAHEFSFENMHENKERIYRIITCPKNYFADMIANSPAPLGIAMKEQCPGIERITRLRRMSDVAMRIDEDVFEVSNLLVADPEIFKIFSLPLIKGNPETALDAPFKVLISEHIAQTYFGDSDPIGRTVRLGSQWDCQITGVLKEIPSNTQMQCDLLGSYSTLEAVGENTNDWGSLFTDYNYLLLNENSQPADVEAMIPSIYSQHVNEEKAAKLKFLLQPLNEIYLYSGRVVNELRPKGDMTLVYLSITIALLIMIIGGVNFVNLSTARANRRAREVGLRKVLGARRGDLALQFLGESVLISMFAMVFGLVLFELGKSILPVFTGREIDLMPWYEPLSFFSITIMVMIVGLIAGSYPALLLSRFAPLASLRGGPFSGSGKSIARRSLVVFQFTIAIALIVLTAIVYRQINYSENFNVGFTRSDIIIMEINSRDAEWASTKCTMLKEQLLRDGVVAEATASFAVPGENRMWITEFVNAERPDEEAQALQILPVDYEFLDFYGLTLLQGRRFSKDHSGDDGETFILTEAAVKQLGLDQPIGARLVGDEEEFSVVGVVSDFKVLPATIRDFPAVLQIVTDAYARVAVKLPPGDFKSQESDLEASWRHVLPDQPFNYLYLDDLISRVYEESARLGTMGIVFASLAIFVACLGILGMASYAVEQRSKEIGIRKVLGSSFIGVVRLFSLETLVLVIIANFLALPLVWYIGNLWLAEFPQRVNIGISVFAAGGAIVSLIALFTVSSQAFKASRTNPVEVLRYE